MGNPENLRPFDELTPEEHRELSRRGGIASGKRRREIAEMKGEFRRYAAALALLQETREEYRAAAQRYVKEDRKRAARRKRE